MSLKVGDTAPPFDVTSSDGKKLKLDDYRGKKNVVLYFYPKDFTPGCTAEACGFRDQYTDLQTRDTEVIGVSLDSDGKHERFRRRAQPAFKTSPSGSRRWQGLRRAGILFEAGGGDQAHHVRHRQAGKDRRHVRQAVERQSPPRRRQGSGGQAG